MLKTRKIWINWKYVSANGRRTKRPYAATGKATGTTADYEGDWVTFDEASRAAADPHEGFDGVGFIVPTGYFFMDVDHSEINSELMKTLRSRFSTYLERSPSKHGFHFYGTLDLSRMPVSNGKLDPRYLCRNSALGLELYIGGLTDRFATFTGETIGSDTAPDLSEAAGGPAVGAASGPAAGAATGPTERSADVPAVGVAGGRGAEAGGPGAGAANVPAVGAGDRRPIADCTDAILWLLDTHMRRGGVKAGGSGERGGGEHSSGSNPSSDECCKYITLTEQDIPEILDELRSQKNGPKFASLFDDGLIPDGKTASEADASLCAMIAFRTGPDPSLIDAIFRESALYRPKWERDDYRDETIKGAIRACKGVFHYGLLNRPPFVICNAKTERVSAALLATYIRENCHYVFVRESERNAYLKYVYEDGVYRLYSDDMFKGLIKAQIMAYKPELVSMKVVNEAYSQLTTDLDYIPETAMNADESIINFQNGLLDIDTLELKPHDPAVLSTIQIPCKWETAPTPTPVFDSYLSTLTDENPATQQLLLEFIGAVLSNVKGWRMKKSLFLVGPGDTGKSQLKALVERIIGRGNYSTMDLEQMEARFGTSIVKGKRLVGSSDMSFMTVKELKTFKKVTGGDGLYMERKGVDGFEGLYDGFIWFCMNQLPRFGGDDGEWVYNRIMPVHCTNVIPLEKQDKQLQDKMFEEREGIIHRAVMAFRTVLENGFRFSEPAEVGENRIQYRQENDSALAFMDECMVKRTEPPKRNDKVTVNVIYLTYRSWYSREYGNQYFKARKEFFKSLAGAVGEDYNSMKLKTAQGLVLMEYTLNPVYFRENDDLLPLGMTRFDIVQ